MILIDLKFIFIFSTATSSCMFRSWYWLVVYNFKECKATYWKWFPYYSDSYFCLLRPTFARHSNCLSMEASISVKSSSWPTPHNLIFNYFTIMLLIQQNCNRAKIISDILSTNCRYFEQPHNHSNIKQRHTKCRLCTHRKQ